MASLRSKVDAASVQVLIADRTASYGKIQCDRAELDLVSSHIAITHTAAHKLMGILVIAGAVVAIVLLWEGRSLASIGWRGFALVSFAWGVALTIFFLWVLRSPRITAVQRP